MAHIEQINFCSNVRNNHPDFFTNKNVLDCGSLDINGNNRYLFSDCNYIGIDVGEGTNVDIVSKIHEFDAIDDIYDTIISTECFEHDMYYKKSLINIIRMLKHGGLFLFTCASTNRAEHGTLRKESNSSPLTSRIPEWNEYYKNLTEKDIIEAIPVDDIFSEYEFISERNDEDLYFWGIKK